MSRDGDIYEFHRLCDGQGPTLTIYRADNGKIFGGYTEIEWASKYGVFGKEGSTFIYSIRDDG